MKILRDECGAASANMYTVHNDKLQAVIIDPCDSFLAEMHINSLSLSVKAILLTHAHYDHASALNEIMNLAHGAQSFIHRLDSRILEDPTMNAAELFGVYDFSARCTNLIDDNDLITAGDFRIKAIHTPGHTPGSVCYLIEDCIFTGDTLFCGNIGRCDLYGGSYRNMSMSLKRIAELDPALRVFPGHGPSSTLEYEMKNNPYLSKNFN